SLLASPCRPSLLRLRCRPPSLSSFFSHVLAPPELYTLSLHDALPISSRSLLLVPWISAILQLVRTKLPTRRSGRKPLPQNCIYRSEEHTSELQSRFDLVCRLLLEKKKTPDQRSSCATRRRADAGRRRT